MKEESTLEDFEDSKELLDGAAALSESSDMTEQEIAVSSGKSRATELRRRIEERLDSKRIALECDYLMLDDMADWTDGLDDYSESQDSLQ